MKPRGQAPSAGSFDIIPNERVLFTLRTSHLRKPWLIAIALLLITGILGYQAHLLLANVRVLAPLTCTGDWEGASSLSDAEADSREASASAAGQKIFCTFPSPSSKPVPLTRAVLALSFASEQEAPIEAAPDEASNIEESFEPEQEGEESADSTNDAQVPTEPPVEESGEVLGETTELQEPETQEASPVEPVNEVPTEASASEEAAFEEPASEPEPEAEPESEPGQESPPEEESEPTARSWWNAFFAIAHAQETEPAFEAETAVTEESSPESAREEPSLEESIDKPAAEESVEEPVIEETGEPTVHDAPASDEVVPEEEEGEVLGVESDAEETEPVSELTLSYTIDGTRWVQLTSFSPLGNEVTFDIDLVSTADLEKLVVRLTADAVGAAPITLERIEVQVHTEAPIEELVEMALPEDPDVLHVYAKEFEIDANARHSCTIEPGILDAAAGSPLPFVAKLLTGDDKELPEQPEASPAEEAEAPPPHTEDGETAPLVESVSGTEEAEEENDLNETSVAEAESAVQDPVVEAVPEGPVDTHDTSFLESVLAAGEGLLEAAGDAAKELLPDALTEPIAILEIGSLPRGIDVRFLESGNYALTLEDAVPFEVPLQITVADLGVAQKGSFSVPLIFTWKEGKDSVVVCQMNIMNKDRHD